MDNTLIQVPISEADMEAALSGLIEQMREAHLHIERTQTETAELSREIEEIRAVTDERMEDLRRMIASFDSRN